MRRVVESWGQEHTPAEMAAVFSHFRGVARREGEDAGNIHGLNEHIGVELFGQLAQSDGPAGLKVFELLIGQSLPRHRR